MLAKCVVASLSIPGADISTLASFIAENGRSESVMMKTSSLIKAILLASTLGAAWAQPKAGPGKAARVGYLTPAQAPDVARIVPVAPVIGDSRDALDVAVFRST